MRPESLRRLVRAGLVTGVTDALFSSVLVVAAYGSTFTRLWQGVASAVLGPQALQGGPGTTAFGLLLHFGVAFFWSAVFLVLYERSRQTRALVATPGGLAVMAAVYGPFIWLVMSLLVLPTLLHRPPAINARWVVQLVGHIPFVALPIVALVRRPRDPAAVGAP